MSSTADPDYAFLLNALKLADGHTPDLVVHPGTTTETLGAVSIRTLYFIRTHGVHSVTMATDVIQNPELYLHILQLEELFLASVSLFMVGLFSFLFLRSVFLLDYPLVEFVVFPLVDCDSPLFVDLRFLVMDLRLFVC